MAVGKRDYDYYTEYGEHAPPDYYTQRIVDWTSVDWNKYNQGNFEATIKYISEQSR